MCGIAGYKVRKRIDPPVLSAMVEELRHRGPDSSGFYSSGEYHAGMRRLSINDLKTGDQPLFNQDKSVILLYNGEIYNSPQLKKDLEKRGHVFRTHCDGEVICHLYDECGENLFGKLDGMFAVALWIEKEKRLILARDIPGEKPLYYCCLSDKEIVFSSEVKSLKHFPGLNLSLDLQAIWDMPTFSWVPEPSTMYESVKALLPGHMLIVDEKSIRIRPYKNHFDVKLEDTSDQGIIKTTRKIVEEAIVSRLLSDVPVGCFLSSGLDSSIVATVAAKHLNRLSTFTIGFEELADPFHGMADESEYAEQYAKEIGSRHHSIHVLSDTFTHLLDDFSYYADQPFAPSSSLGLLAIAKAAREAGIKVLLSGDGADENFGGYSWYSYLMTAKGASYPADHRYDISFQNLEVSLEERIRKINNYSPQKRAWAWHYYASEEEKGKLFSKDVCRKAISSHRFFNQFDPSEEWQPESFIKQDRQLYLPNEMLKKVDRMTMAHSVEGRPPFVAPSVLSLADKLRYSHFVQGGQLKWVLRKAFEDILPSDIINRPKHGFNVPIDHWFRNSWFFLVEEAFSEKSALSRLGIIHKDSFEVAREMVFSAKVNGHTILSMVILNKWLQRNF